LARRWTRLERALDINRFLSFMAMEIMIGHRDGYCLSRNNYRIYHDPEHGCLVFLPHGMDQLFGKPDAPWFPRMSGLVARAVMETTEGPPRYRERFETLFTNVFQVERLVELIDERVAITAPLLKPTEARAFKRHAALLKERVLRRRTELAKQLGQARMARTQFVNDVLLLRGWQPMDEPVGGSLLQMHSPDGRPALYIKAGPVTGASWRTRIIVPFGRYRFEGAVRCTNVLPLRYGRNQGAGLRVSGVRNAQPYRLIGNAEWTDHAVEFEVNAAEQEIELICELRARAGEAWYDRESLRVRRIEK
jgi:hypothetical protein